MEHTNKQKSQTPYLSQAQNWSENIHISGKAQGPVFFASWKTWVLFEGCWDVWEGGNRDRSAYQFAAVLWMVLNLRDFDNDVYIEKWSIGWHFRWYFC